MKNIEIDKEKKREKEKERQRKIAEERAIEVEEKRVKAELLEEEKVRIEKEIVEKVVKIEREREKKIDDKVVEEEREREKDEEETRRRIEKDNTLIMNSTTDPESTEMQTETEADFLFGQEDNEDDDKIDTGTVAERSLEGNKQLLTVIEMSINCNMFIFSLFCISQTREERRLEQYRCRIILLRRL